MKKFKITFSLNGEIETKIVEAASNVEAMFTAAHEKFPRGVLPCNFRMAVCPLS